MRSKTQFNKSSAVKPRRRENKFNVATGKLRSGLERYCFNALEEAGIDFKYEPYAVELLPAFDSELEIYEGGKKGLVQKSSLVRAMTYTPDFVGKNWVIEVKGMMTADFTLKWKFYKKVMKGSGVTLYMPRNQKQVDNAINHIKHGKISGELEPPVPRTKAKPRNKVPV